jgi:hypothetical protein
VAPLMHMLNLRVRLSTIYKIQNLTTEWEYQALETQKKTD